MKRYIRLTIFWPQSRVFTTGKTVADESLHPAQAVQIFSAVRAKHNYSDEQWMKFRSLPNNTPTRRQCAGYGAEWILER